MLRCSGCMNGTRHRSDVVRAASSPRPRNAGARAELSVRPPPSDAGNRHRCAAGDIYPRLRVRRPRAGKIVCPHRRASSRRAPTILDALSALFGSHFRLDQWLARGRISTGYGTDLARVAQLVEIGQPVNDGESASFSGACRRSCRTTGPSPRTSRCPPEAHARVRCRGV